MSLGRWWRARRARLRQLWVVGAIAACAVTAGSAMGYFESLQVRALDLLMYLQSPRQPGTIVIVAVDDAAFDALGRRQPIPRDYLARVLRGVGRAGAATVGFDISFRTAGPAAEDAALARAIAEFTEQGSRRLVVASAALPERGPLADSSLAKLMLLTQSFVRPAGWIAVLGVQLVAVLLAGLVMTAMRLLWGTAVCLAAAAILGIPASLAALRRGYLVDFLLPVLAVALLGLGADLLARRRLREALGRYVSPEVAARVERRPEELAGERREVSILFSDLRGFTTLSERMAPEQMAARLTEYFDAMTAAIFEHRGMVNVFIGDAIMAVFGAPLDDPDHARHAVESALGMQRALASLNRRWESEGLPPLRMGLGVHTGEVFAGNVGREGKVKYAVVGDPVNLASRVEGLNKELGTIMLVTESAYRKAALDVGVTDRGLVQVKGRQEPVRIYEVAPPEPDEGEC